MHREQEQSLFIRKIESGFNSQDTKIRGLRLIPGDKLRSLGKS